MRFPVYEIATGSRTSSSSDGLLHLARALGDGPSPLRSSNGSIHRGLVTPEIPDREVGWHPPAHPLSCGTTHRAQSENEAAEQMTLNRGQFSRLADARLQDSEG
jgi:hypothetical protein